jgi:hypothetical protein
MEIELPNRYKTKPAAFSGDFVAFSIDLYIQLVNKANHLIYVNNQRYPLPRCPAGRSFRKSAGYIND